MVNPGILCLPLLLLIAAGVCVVNVYPGAYKRDELVLFPHDLLLNVLTPFA